MTVDDIVGRILTRIDDNSETPESVTDAEALAAVNEGQDFFCWLTLCLETTSPLTFTANNSFGAIRSTFPDFLVPLRVAIGPKRLRPSTLKDFDAKSDQWQTASGSPSRYVTEGFNFWAIDSQPAFDTVSNWTYARSPIPLALGMVPNQSPEIPEIYHPALVNYGQYRVKLKEGAQGLQRGIGQFNQFLDAAQEHGDFVRARSRAAGYDTLPFELKLFDRRALYSMDRRKRRVPPAPPAISGDTAGSNAGTGDAAA